MKANVPTRNVSRAQFEALLPTLPYGSDCWSDAHTLRELFAPADVARVLYIERPTTGLWRDGEVITTAGTITRRRVYG